MTKKLLIGAACLASGIVAVAATTPTLLPTGRRIVAPQGPVATVGTLPQGLALTRDGATLLVVESGTRPTALRLLDARTLAERGLVTLEGTFGSPLLDERGDGAWIAGANTDELIHVDAEKAAVDRTVGLPRGCWNTSVARVRAGLLAATCEQTASLAFVDERSGATIATVAVGPHPSAVVAAADGARVYVTAWAGRSVDVVDVASAKVVRRVGVGLHPEALALAPDGAHLFVANGDDDSISIVDVRALDRVPRVVPLRLDGSGAFGNNLNALALSEDKRRLYVSAGAANAVYVLAIESGGGLRRLGAIPTGWYPTAVLPAGGALYVANGFGERSRANPEYDALHDQYGKGYVTRTDVGSIRKLTIPGDDALRAGDARVVELAGGGALRPDPVVRAHGPIEHVIYVIKENRTYDQLFGDIAAGNGDPSLVLFGAQITPNEHAIVERFGLFDRTFCDAQISADGHTWSTAAIANDYLEKTWQADYSHPYRRPYYDFESPVSPNRPHAGYLWDAVLKARLTLRNYGEFVALKGGSFFWEGTPAFVAHTDARFPGYDLSVSDLDREAEWEREFRGFERGGVLPALEIVRFPNDHTAGTRPGALTPQAFVAQNDAAFGKLLDVVSHSRFWRNTAVFAIEDDAQDGADHVDEHRTTFLLASPYARGGVHHQTYTTAAVLRTIELILGLPPMSTFDEHATPLYAAFTKRADLRPYDALAPKIDINARNAKTAYRASDSAKLDFDEADEADAATLNDVMWHAVKGVAATPPPYGSFR